MFVYLCAFPIGKMKSRCSVANNGLKIIQCVADLCCLISATGQGNNVAHDLQAHELRGKHMGRVAQGGAEGIQRIMPGAYGGDDGCSLLGEGGDGVGWRILRGGGLRGLCGEELHLARRGAPAHVCHELCGGGAEGGAIPNKGMAACGGGLPYFLFLCHNIFLYGCPYNVSVLLF